MLSQNRNNIKTTDKLTQQDVVLPISGALRDATSASAITGDNTDGSSDDDFMTVCDELRRIAHLGKKTTP